MAWYGGHYEKVPLEWPDKLIPIWIFYETFLCAVK